MGERVTEAPTSRIPFKPGFLTDDLGDPATVRFVGIRCKECGVALLGVRRNCENCAGRQLELVTFSSSGRIYSYTVQRYPPPSPFQAVTPWSPRILAWVDLDERGPRVLAPVSGSPEQAAIGMPVIAEFAVQWRDSLQREVVGFVFHFRDDAHAEPSS